MRVRTLAVAGAGAALVLAVPATAATPRYRTTTVTYKTPGGVAGVINGDGYVNGDQYGSTEFATQRSEYAFDLTLVDDSGLPALAELGQDLDGDGKSDVELGTVCGKTSAPIRLRKAGLPVHVYLVAGPCGTGASVPVKGTVTARLHAKR